MPFCPTPGCSGSTFEPVTDADSPVWRQLKVDHCAVCNKLVTRDQRHPTAAPLHACDECANITHGDFMALVLQRDHTRALYNLAGGLRADLMAKISGHAAAFAMNTMLADFMRKSEGTLDKATWQTFAAEAAKLGVEVGQAFTREVRGKI